MKNTPLPHSILLVCSSRSQQLRHNIVWGEGGLKGQARGEERDHSDEIGGKQGEYVNNFVADCPKCNSLNALKIKLHQESFILTFNLLYGYFRFIPVDNRH